MDERTEQLLESEQVITDLVAELEELKREVGGYSEAKQSLDEAGSGLAVAADSLKGLGQRVHDMVAALRAIGTPELLRMQEEIAESQRSSFEDLEKALKEHREHADIARQEVRRGTRRWLLIHSVLLLLLLVGVIAIAGHLFDLFPFSPVA